MMRTTYILVLFLGFILMVRPVMVAAHGSGESYVAVDNIFVEENPVAEFVSTSRFDIGSDVASASGYIIDTPIVFRVDEENFLNPYENTREQPTPVFRWTFGDISKPVEGNTVTHTFDRSGTYVVKLEVKYPGTNETYAQVNSIQIDVLPSPGYRVPVANIKVDDKQVDDPGKNIIEVRSGRGMTFDASGSTGDTLSYAWDFSDDTTGTGKSVLHRYKNDDYFPMFPVLRVTDKNNLVSFAFVVIDTPQNNNVFMHFWGWLRDVITSVFSG